MYARARRAAPPPRLPLNGVVLSHSLGFGIAARLASLLPGSTFTERAFGNATYVRSDVGDVTPYSLRDNLSNDLAGLWNAAKDNRIVLWAGAIIEINDYADGTAASTLADAATLIAAIHAQNPWKVHAVTCIATAEYDAISPHPTRGNLADDRDAFSDGLSAVAGVHRVIDLRTRAPLQDPRDTEFFSDGIHTTSAGSDEAADGIAEDLAA